MDLVASWCRDKIIVAPGTKVTFVTLEHDTTREACVKFPKEGMVVPQGGVVLVQGHIGHTQKSVVGKSTFLKALARVYVPFSGYIHYPDNLRVRLLDTEPDIISDSIISNLEFGNQHKHAATDVRALCRLLRISRYLWDDLVTDSDGSQIWGVALAGANGHRLSVSDRVKLTIARALLSSVHMLLLNNTLDLLNIIDATHIVSVLERFCEHRGVECLRVDMAVPWKLRKKTTVLLSTRNTALEERIPTRVVLERQIHIGVQQETLSSPSGSSVGGCPSSGWFTGKSPEPDLSLSDVNPELDVNAWEGADDADDADGWVVTPRRLRSQPQH
jgi:ABC-type cobalamin/Fe3+-siderophores transport system ATPase subunit